MANVKLRLVATYYRLLDGDSHRTIYKGDVFETDEANAERLIKAGAAEDAKAKAEPQTEGDPAASQAVDPPEKKPTPRGAK